VVILRDQTEEFPLCWVWSNIPEHSSKIMIELRWNRLNDKSLGQMIGPGSEDMTLKRMNPDIHPPLKGTVS